MTSVETPRAATTSVEDFLIDTPSKIARFRRLLTDDPPSVKRSVKKSHFLANKIFDGSLWYDEACEANFLARLGQGVRCPISRPIVGHSRGVPGPKWCQLLPGGRRRKSLKILTFQGLNYPNYGSESECPKSVLAQRATPEYLPSCVDIKNKLTLQSFGWCHWPNMTPRKAYKNRGFERTPRTPVETPENLY